MWLEKAAAWVCHMMSSLNKKKKVFFNCFLNWWVSWMEKRKTLDHGGYPYKVVYSLLKFEFLSSSAVDTEVRSEENCEEMALWGTGRNWRENGICSFTSLSAVWGWYWARGGGWSACRTVSANWEEIVHDLWFCLFIAVKPRSGLVVVVRFVFMTCRQL